MKYKTKGITKKVITTLLLIFMMGCSFSFGVGYSKQITAWFYDIQIKINGNYVKLTKEPFIYDGSIYVPIRDVANNLGFDISWDDNTKTVNLSSKGYYYNTIDYNYPYVVINKKSIYDIENELNNDYEEYIEGTDDLYFEYELSEKSSYIEIVMEGQNFKKYSTEWEKRDEDDFRDFIEDIAEMVALELNDDVKITVYDRNSKSVAKYEYDEDDSELSVEYEYDEDMDIDDLENRFDDEYEEYTKGSHDLEFNYSLKEYSSYVKVKMEGENFDRSSSYWDDRDNNDFREFIEDIAEEVYDVFDNKDVKIYIYDDDDDKAAEYFYDEDDDEFRVIYEY